MATNLKATGQPLIPKTQPSPSRISAPSQIRQWKALPGSEFLARDIENLSGGVDRIDRTLSTTPVSVDKIHLTNAAGELVAAVGDFTYEGEQHTNYFSEIHVGDPLLKHDPTHALFNANTDGSVIIGQNGWLDVLDPFGADAAWLGTQNDTLPVTGAADNGSGLIRLTVAGHTLITGNTARVQKVGGVFQPPPPGGTPANNATGTFTVTKIDATHVDLQGSVFAGTYTSGGVIDRVLQINGAVNNGSGLIRLQTSVPHTYEGGDRVDVASVGGVPNATGQWTISAPDTTHIDLVGSTWGGTYTTGGTCLRFFAGMLAQTFAIGSSFANYKLRAFADGTLRIQNATSSVTSATGSITQDPAVPSLIVNALSGSTVTASITIDASVPSIVIQKIGGGKIIIDGSIPNIGLYDSSNHLVIKLDPNAASPIELNGTAINPAPPAVTGYSDPTGVSTTVGINTATATTQQVAEYLAGIAAALKAQGIIAP
jgi:hypothetical protein